MITNHNHPIVIIITNSMAIIIIMTSIILLYLSIRQDTTIPYQGSQEQTLPQHGFRLAYLHEQFIED